MPATCVTAGATVMLERLYPLQSNLTNGLKRQGQPVTGAQRKFRSRL